MKLFYSPGACSLAPHIVLREAGLPFTLEKVDIPTHRTADGRDYYAINPKGYVPFLELDSGEGLSEGPVIAQYVAETAGNTALLPPATDMRRYRVVEWQNYITSELHKSFGAQFNPQLDAAAKDTFKASLLKKYQWIDSVLAKSAFLTGDTFSVADAYLFTVTNWCKHVGLDISGLANLQRFLAAVAARPAVRDAMQAEGLLG